MDLSISRLMVQFDEASQKLRDALSNRFTSGDKVRVHLQGGGTVHGTFHAIGEDPCEVGVILEHGQVRWFSADRVETTEPK